MIKILFICHGNICRSPMAEYILKDMVKKQKRDKEFVIDSCATSREEIIGGVGNPIYPPVREILKKNRIPFHERRAVQLQKSHYKQYDYLICMDDNNVRSSERIVGGDSEGKIKKLLDFAGEGGDVSDPWYTRDFALAYDDISRGCKALLAWLEELHEFN